jgi:putative transposase
MTPARGREMIDLVRDTFQVSIRKACRAIPACRASYHYRSRRPEQAPLRKRVREIAETHMLRLSQNHGTAASRGLAGERQARASSLPAGRPADALKPPSRRVMVKLRDDRSNATGNQVWAMDWMYVELFDRRRLWVLTVVDT